MAAGSALELGPMNSSVIADLAAFEASSLPPLGPVLPRPVVDSHTHADSTAEYSGLAVDLSVALAASVGVTRWVQVGCDVPSSEFAVEFASRQPSVIASVAIHPNDAARHGDRLEADLTRIDQLAALPGVRAVGETGLDHFRTRDQAGQQTQVHSFEAHIDIAKRHDRTLVIHDRDAHADILSVLDRVGAPGRVVMHCFSGDADFARECLDRGFWLSFPGVITFGSAGDQREALAITPDDRLLVETDAPYLTPVPRRGKPNAPYLLPHTVTYIAEQRGADLAQLCDQITTNSFAAFGGEWGPEASHE